VKLKKMPHHHFRTELVPQVPGLLLIGPPGSGKGTIGKALAMLPGFTHCSSGDIIRTATRRDGVDSRRSQLVANGGLISDEDLWELFDLYLDQYTNANDLGDRGQFLLIDGIPRCQSQVDELAQRVAICGVFCLDCGNPDILVRRLQQRFTLDARSDDANQRVIQQRLRLFHKQTQPLIDAYPKEIVFHIDASQRPESVLCAVLKSLSQIRNRGIVCHREPVG
jgi:adenylate kinase family enzyme